MDFSKKLRNRIDRLRYAGYFSVKCAEEKKKRLVTGCEEKLCLYWLVDESNGIIVDAKFQGFGTIALLAAADIACELTVQKNYDQVSRISAELLDRYVRDENETPAFSEKNYVHLNQVIRAIEKASTQCVDIPYAARDYDMTPIARNDISSTQIPNWALLSTGEQIKIIEEVVDKEIRPYIELDAGGIQILALKNNNEVHIAYQGACTTCYSSTGSTLSAIQQILNERIHPDLTVIPIL